MGKMSGIDVTGMRLYTACATLSASDQLLAKVIRSYLMFSMPCQPLHRCSSPKYKKITK